MENRGGGASIPGTQAVATAAPDGYTLGVMDLSLVTNPGLFGARLPYETERDFSAIGAVVAAPHVLLGSPGGAARSFADFLAAARARPGELAFAHAGNGTANHLASVQLQMAAGLRLSLVGYRGAAPANAAVAAGEVPFGLLRALAVTGTRRSQALPDVPTFAELGLPQMDTESVFGVIAPAGVPAEVVQRLNALMVAPAGTAPIGPRMEAMGYTLMASTAEDYASLIRREISKWRGVVAAAGVQPE